MTTIKNVQPLSAENLFDLLKTQFGPYIDSKLDTNLSIEYAHVYDVINISFPEIIEGTVFTLLLMIMRLNYLLIARTPNTIPTCWNST
jgi:hypothetical protein